MMKSAQEINLLGMTRSQLEDFFLQLGEKSFRAQQISKWIHHEGVLDFTQMLNLSKKLRDKLVEVAEITPPKIVKEQLSKDGTRKWLMQLDDGNKIETVFIPEQGRGTLCISSQVGCILTCSFCNTGKQGYSRNLTAAEITGQIWQAKQQLGWNERTITNVVLMGMGEPLLNFDNSVAATTIAMDDFAYGLSRRRVTVSTAGVVPAIDRLKEVGGGVSLALSLHTADDKLRDELVPLNKKYPLKELLLACENYLGQEPRRRITMEYVLLDHVNDSVQDARALIKLLKRVPSKINLIPFNPFPGAEYKVSTPHRIEKFSKVLADAGMTTITRRERGADISAACGQLAGEVMDVTSRPHKLAA